MYSHADVVHQGTGLEDGLDLAEADVLPVLQLDQVLLPVDDADAAGLLHLADVSGAEPSPAFARRIYSILHNSPQTRPSLMTFALATQFQIYLLWDQCLFSMVS